MCVICDIVRAHGCPEWQEANRLLRRIERKVDLMSADQDKLDADVKALEDGFAVVAKEIADLKVANPAIDFTGLDKAVADVVALAPAAPPAPPAPAAPSA